jgi:hypothetical protein
MNDHIRFSTMREAPHAARRVPPAAWLTSGQDAPVFVDHSGRRARGVRLGGLAAAGVCAFWLAGLTVGMAGFSAFPTIGLRVLSHAAVARQLALRADAGADRSAIALRQAGPSGTRARLADAESSVRVSPCPASRAVLGANRLPMGHRRSTPRPAPSSSRQALALTGRPACLSTVTAASRGGPASRLT